MNNYKKPLYYVAVIALLLSGCASAPGQKEPAKCQKLIERNWGFAEDQMGYDTSQPSRSRYKLVADDSGSILILDAYNNRIVKSDPAGKFQVNIRPPKNDLRLPEFPMQAEIKDVATTSGGQILAAISAPLTVTSSVTKNVFFAIYEFDTSGQFRYKLADWRYDEDFRYRIATGSVILNIPLSLPDTFLSDG